MTGPGHPQLAAYLANQRWFAGKGRDFRVAGVRVAGEVAPGLRIELVEVAYADGVPERETFQLPVSVYPEPQAPLEHALVRQGEDGWTYDALHDRAASAELLRAFVEERSGEVSFLRVPGHDLDPDARGTFFTGEQSNSSVVFGEDAMLKIFRKVHPGQNPDITLHRALTGAGSTHVAHLYGWISDGTHDLGMLQQFLRTASDGWELALISARNLLTSDDLHADEVGGDFAGEAHRLGVAVAAVHRALAAELGTGSEDAAFTADQMRERLAAAVVAVPDLGPYAAALGTHFDQLAVLGAHPVQRIHGDLHLGQTLRTSLGWKLVDFEGEPAKPLAERLLPDSPWRDVAGMIRSFHYAAQAVARDLDLDESREQRAHRSREWSTHNVTAFLAGYTEERGSGLTATERVLLDAYIADKAIYEAAYEARNRPAWLPIPLSALADLAETR